MMEPARQPLTEREKAFRVSARLFVRIATLQGQGGRTPPDSHPRSAMLLRETKRKFRESMELLHRLDREGGRELTRPSAFTPPADY